MWSEEGREKERKWVVDFRWLRVAGTLPTLRAGSPDFSSTSESMKSLGNLRGKRGSHFVPYLGEQRGERGKVRSMCLPCEDRTRVPGANVWQTNQHQHGRGPESVRYLIVILGTGSLGRYLRPSTFLINEVWLMQ
jgi:hypothetical protein